MDESPFSLSSCNFMPFNITILFGNVCIYNQYTIVLHICAECNTNMYILVLTNMYILVSINW